MPIRQDDNQPRRKIGIVNLVLIGVGVLLLLSSFIPSQGMQQVPRVPYSLFINQVDDGEVKRAFITQEQIRYELTNPEEGQPALLATTADVVDNPWSVCAAAAQQTGEELAHALLQRVQGQRPAILVGASVGGLVIWECLHQLAKRGDAGRGQSAQGSAAAGRGGD